jgi:hypothetical protein
VQTKGTILDDPEWNCIRHATFFVSFSRFLPTICTETCANPLFPECIRMAIGAQSHNVVRLVLAKAVGFILAGAVAGIAVALGVTRFLASFLYGVKAGDPITLVAVAFLLALVALAACYIPARRATKVDPLVALRYE